MLLPAIVANAAARPHRPLVLIQSSTAQSGVAVLRAIVNDDTKTHRSLVVCLLFPPSSLVDDGTPRSGRTVLDLTTNVPGYQDGDLEIRECILNAIRDVTATNPTALSVVIDSVDTLLSDIGSVSKTYVFLTELLSLVSTRPAPSRLILHLNASCLPSPTTSGQTSLLALLTETRFSSALVHLTAHPPVLLKHLATAYLTPPPPLSAPEKFWRVFIPIAERGSGAAPEAERLVYGSEGEGSSSGEIVVEVLLRGGSSGDSVAGRRNARGVERGLEGWTRSGPCELSDLESLRTLYSKRPVIDEIAPDPTKNVSFNLNLTPEQQQSRAQVPLPYVHEGKPPDQVGGAPSGAIFYDPDSADDIDDDDPDEDLDI